MDLKHVHLKTQCDEPWADMSGDDKSRLCGTCDKQVYNLSSMTSEEAKKLWNDSFDNPCIRLHRRPDGTIVTADCKSTYTDATTLSLEIGVS